MDNDMRLGRRSVLIYAVIIALVLGLGAVYYFMAPRKTVLHVSTTTSLYATGLLDELAQKFEKTHPDIVVQFIPVGSGEALRRAADGAADMVFVHAPLLEKKYIESGTIIDGKIVAYNFFVIVGPASDPAGIKGLSPEDAFRKIFSAGEAGKALFVSRGDNSGTHVKELSLWKRAGLNPAGRSWYIESGAGMSDTLLISNEKGAYTLSDIGTYLKLKAGGKIELVVLVSGGDELLNIYSVYIVNPEKVKGVNYDAAKAFYDFVTSDVGEKIIASYGVKEFGQPLFYPAKGKVGWLKTMWEKLSSG